MGVYSTMEITRQDALKEIKKRIPTIDDLPDNLLEEILFRLVGEKTLNNFCIVDSYKSRSKYVVGYNQKVEWEWEWDGV